MCAMIPDLEASRQAFKAFARLLSRDALLTLRYLGRLGVRVPPDQLEPFGLEVRRVMDEALGNRLGDVSLGRVGRGILAAVHRHRVAFPRKYALLVKALLTIEGTARLLHPAFSFEPAAREYVLDARRRSICLSGLLEALWRGVALVGLSAIVAAEGQKEVPVGRFPEASEERSLP